MLSPGYSYDTAFVEFLNLEDAVRFMESNQVAFSHRSSAGSLPWQEGVGQVEREAWGGEGWCVSYMGVCVGWGCRRTPLRVFRQG